MGKQRHLCAAAGLCAFAVSAACNEHPLKPVEYSTEGVGSGDLPLSINRDVDILFVIDNSGSMAEEQATLARNFGALIERLEDPMVNANYRIAVTTTDAGHVAYCGDTGGEHGKLQFQSCLGRTGEFQFSDTTGPIDRYEEACASICDLAAIETKPTLVATDPEPKPRPWIERTGAGTNLVGEVTPAQAFECIGPQGIAGCGFESTLESMRLSLIRSTTATEKSFGFMRPGALLAIVFVTDEEDCSARTGDPAFAEVWDPDGEQTYWSEANRDRGVPSSEICWFAGVECTGGPGQYDECHPVNRGIDGQPSSADDSVLYDVKKYIDFVQEVEDAKREINAGAEVLVAVLGGVPDNYAGGGADISYADGAGDDADFQVKHGIGPGCQTEAGEGVPPVRLRAFAEAFALSEDPSDRNLYSICADNYTPALDQIAAHIGRQLRPACMPSCVADSDLVRPGLNPQCTLTEEWSDADGTNHDEEVLPCIGGADAPDFPEGEDVCYRVLTDDGTTESIGDDMDPTCIEEGWNLQFEVLRTADGERAGGSSVNADCVVSQSPEIECPNLG